MAISTIQNQAHGAVVATAKAKQVKVKKPAQDGSDDNKLEDKAKGFLYNVATAKLSKPKNSKGKLTTLNLPSVSQHSFAPLFSNHLTRLAMSQQKKKRGFFG